MQTIDRNEDVNLRDGETIPPDCYLHKGKLLPDKARFAKVPFGICRDWVKSGKAMRLSTIGIIIRKSDRKKFNAYLNSKKKTA